MKKIVFEDRADGGLPRFVGNNAAHGAVVRGDLELRQKLRALAVSLPAEPCEVAAIPAVAEDHADGVVALRELRRDVIGLEVDPLAVVGPARREDVAADDLAVDFALINSERGDVQHSRLDRSIDS